MEIVDILINKLFKIEIDFNFVLRIGVCFFTKIEDLTKLFSKN